MRILENYIWEQNERPVNEDAMGLKIFQKGKSFCSIAIVCDGIGGLLKGEEASSFLVRELLDAMDSFMSKGIFRKKYIKNYFFRVINLCDKKIKNYSKENQIFMGTTLSMVITIGRKAYLFHLGDSSIYGGSGELKKLTVVHSENHRLTKAIGVGKYHNPFFRTIKLGKNYHFLICSDGFDGRTKGIINHLLSKNNTETEIRKRLQDISEYAKTKGEKDNISAIFLMFSN